MNVSRHSSDTQCAGNNSNNSSLTILCVRITQGTYKDANSRFHHKRFSDSVRLQADSRFSVNMHPG